MSENIIDNGPMNNGWFFDPTTEVVKQTGQSIEIKKTAPGWHRSAKREFVEPLQGGDVIEITNELLAPDKDVLVGLDIGGIGHWVYNESHLSEEPERIVARIYSTNYYATKQATQLNTPYKCAFAVRADNGFLEIWYNDILLVTGGDDVRGQPAYAEVRMYHPGGHVRFSNYKWGRQV